MDQGYQKDSKDNSVLNVIINLLYFQRAGSLWPVLDSINLHLIKSSV